MRLDRALSNLGYGSRTDAKRFVDQGRVCVEHVVATDPAQSVDPHNVTFDGELLERVDGITVILHKPVGYVCSHDEDEGPRAYDLLPLIWQHRNPQVVSVGRLDKDSSGLIVLTDNHAMVHRLTSPKHHVPKRYEVLLDDAVDDQVVSRFQNGELLLGGDKKPCLPAELRRLEDPRRAEVVLTEGRYRQVRRMFAACGRQVIELHRVQFGSWLLGDLPIGEWKDGPETDPSIVTPSK
jgi:16S rRNA pseudouridine516 synthase